MSAAGNDFVLIDGKFAKNPKSLAVKLCDRKEGIGADGLLVVRKTPVLGFDYYNADGSFTFCGNGTRATAWWMSQEGWTLGKRAFNLETSQGVLNAKICRKERVSMEMPPAVKARLNISLKLLNRDYQAHFINTGVPHAIVFVKNIKDFHVALIGHALRQHPLFAPAGVNADFVQIKSGKIHIRTYERGVEAETLACGTGAVAAAVITCLLGKCRSPVEVIARGGLLRVSFNSDSANTIKDLRLEGSAKIIYSGEIVL
jgi:diaminopimelate epimerase